MGNPVVHFELMSKNPAKVSGFYAKIFGWKMQPIGGPMDYRLVDTGAQPSGAGGINGGIMKPDRPEPWPGNMLFYIGVDDLAAYRNKVIAQGGKIHVDGQELVNAPIKSTSTCCTMISNPSRLRPGISRRTC